MLIQILEAQDYSSSALRTYRTLGEIISGPCAEVRQADINILVVRLGHQLDAAFLEPYSRLKAIVSPTTGLTHIDREYCTRHDIHVYSLQEHQDKLKTITSTAECSFALMLALLRKIPVAHHDVLSRRQWQRDPFKSHQIAGMTLGLIGLGRVATHMATYARAFGMHVIAHDPYIPDARFTDLSIQSLSLDQLCQAADVISMHANERADNYHLLGAEQIRQMKKSTLLINTARGSLLDEKAVANALKEKQLAGIACDVLADEGAPGFPACSELFIAADQGFNVILTPHIGGCTIEAMHITEEILADHVYQELNSQDG